MLAIGLSLVSFATGGTGGDHPIALWPSDTHSTGRARSAGADLVVLGPRAPERGAGVEYVARVNELVERLPTTLLVRASDVFEGAEMVLDDA